MSYPVESPQGTSVQYFVQQDAPEIEGAATTAFFLEMVFGFFGLLGIGRVYSGHAALGIGLLVTFWAYLALAIFLSLITVGLAGCFFAPLTIAIPIISAIQVRTHIRKNRLTGSWKTVFIVVAVSVVVLFTACFGFGLIGYILSMFE
jgi:hypothetical protein